MATFIKNVRNKNLIEFDKGAFDDWCVYLTRCGQSRYAPRDTEYFQRLQELGRKHGCHNIYNDFVQYYQHTTKEVNPAILKLIADLSYPYHTDAEEIEIWHTVIYAGMIAEENKTNAVLKKRIKRLGMHQVLIEGINPEVAANFSKGRKWRELDLIMTEKGF